MGVPDNMSHLTQPEPINHNELKRLLIECFDEVFKMNMGNWADVQRAHMSVTRRISQAILDGDDS